MTSGNGKCCRAGDLSSSGCDPLSIKQYEKLSKYKDYKLQLVCSALNMTDAVYRESPSEQPIAAGSSQPYEMCPHQPQQCDAKGTLDMNYYSQRQSKLVDTEKELKYYINEPYRVNLTQNDGSEW